LKDAIEISKDRHAQGYKNNNDAMLAIIQLLCLPDHFSSEERKKQTTTEMERK
jgi:hypothetical protein